MSYSKELADILVAYMDENGCHYEFDREKGMIKTAFTLRNKLKHVYMCLHIMDKGYVSHTCIDVNADEDCRMEVAKYLTMANYGLFMGNFELNFKNGEIRYKYTLDCDPDTLTSERIERSIVIPFSMFERYGDELLKIMFGFETAEDAIKNAEGDLGNGSVG